MMARSGTKRKFKGTTPGRQNVNKLSHDRLAIDHPDRTSLPEALRTSPKSSTMFGRMNLNGLISDVQYEAGNRYMVIVGEYRVSIGIPDTGNRDGKGYMCLGQRICEDCECQRRKERYDNAYETLMRIGYRCARAVAHAAIYDSGCINGDISTLRIGLDALAEHFGISGKKYAK